MTSDHTTATFQITTDAEHPHADTTTNTTTGQSPQNVKPCMCGSTDHRRISHLKCPLNPRRGETRKYNKRLKIDEAGNKVQGTLATSHTHNIPFQSHQNEQDPGDLVDSEAIEINGSNNGNVHIPPTMALGSLLPANLQPMVTEVRRLVITTYRDPETSVERREKLSFIMQNICNNDKFHHGVINDCATLGMNAKETMELVMDMCTRQMKHQQK